MTEYEGLPGTLLRSLNWISRSVVQGRFWSTLLLVFVFLLILFSVIRLGLFRYHWHAGTASGYLLGFFLMAYTCIIFLRHFGLTTIFITIDAMAARAASPRP